MRAHILFASLALLTVPAAAETCLRTCFVEKHLPSDVTDDQIRTAMKGCRNQCIAEITREAERRGLGKDLASCRAEPLSDAEFKQVRSASSSFIVQSNIFTWDITNVLPHKLIKELIVVTQAIDLSHIELSGSAMVLPGDTQTVLVTGFFDGYPEARMGTRVQSMLACTVD